MSRIASTRTNRVPGFKGNRIAAMLAALATATMLTAAPAQAGTEVSIVPHGFGAIPIEVISENGKSWTNIKDAVVPLSATIGIGRTGESVTAYYVRQMGQPGTYQTNNLVQEILSPYLVRVDKNLNFLGHTHYLTAAEKQGILAMCNAQLGTGAGIHQTHSLFGSVDLELIAHFTNGVPAGQINLGGYPGQKRPGTALVPVHCKGVLQQPGGVVAEHPKELKVTSIELFRTTYSHATTQPSPATVCKKARWLVRMTTNKAGPVQFKLWLQNGAGPMTSKVVDAWSAFDGNGGFKAEYAEWTEVEKTSLVQGMAEDMTNPIGQTTGWKSITQHCTGVGGGGLADVPKPDQDGPSPLKVEGELMLADQDGVPKDQPRLGQAVFKIWPNQPGNTSYKLTCTGGREWTGTLPTHPAGNGKLQAVGAHTFNIDKTEQIGCALRSTSMPGDPVIAVATKLFEVIKRNPDLDGPGGVTQQPRPQNDRKPQRLVAPGTTTAPPSRPPRLTCIGGKSTGTACFCPARTVKVQVGPNVFRCTVGSVATGRLPNAGPSRLVPPRQNARPQIMVGPNRGGFAHPAARPGQRESTLGQRRFVR